MSTTSNTTAMWQSSSDLTRSEAALISAHWTEITRHLAPPGVAWKWGEIPISHKVKYNWKESGLITRAPGNGKWETTMTLWCHVIDRAGDDETIGGEATGQQLLLEDTVTPSRATRYLGDQSPARPRSAVQATLTGDTVDQRVVRSQHEPDWTRVNAQKGMHGHDDRSGAARHPRQARLQTFEDYDAGKWDVNVQWFRGSSAVVAPAGCVY